VLVPKLIGPSVSGTLHSRDRSVRLKHVPRNPDVIATEQLFLPQPSLGAGAGWRVRIGHARLIRKHYLSAVSSENMHVFGVDFFEGVIYE
jgi:hypothetical protein